MFTKNGFLKLGFGDMGPRFLPALGESFVSWLVAISAVSLKLLFTKEIASYISRLLS
jgi:hypothetical protein